MFARPRPLLAKLPPAIAAVWLLASALSPALADNLVIRPVPAMVRSGDSLALSATTADGRPMSVQWRLVSGRGAIDPTSGQYTPPIGVQRTEYAVVEASTPDGSYKGSASIEVRQAQIQVSPPVVRVTPGSSVQLTAVLRDGTKPESVIWSVDQDGPHGHVSAGLGLYQAPDAPVPEPIYVKAISGTDPSNLTYAMILVVESVQLRIVPENPAVPVGGTLQLAAKRPDGSDASVEWHLTGPGSISPQGLYTAPNKPPSSDQAVVVEAVSLDPQLPGSGTATITVGPVRVAVDPPQASVGVGSSLRLRATVTGAVDTTVTWAVKDGRGTVTPDGTYTAPAGASAPETATVVAASTVDPNATGACVVSVVPLTVAVSPTSASVHLGNTLRFGATVTGAANPSVIWQVVTDGGGSIDSSGLYKAPAAMPPSSQTVRVRAISRQDPNRWADALVTLLPNLTVTVSPQTAIVRVGGQVKLQASVSGGGGVRWAVDQGPEAGTVDADGTYHAPFAADQAITGVRVTATSVDDATASATALITVMPHVQVAITGPARVQSRATANYTAEVANFIGNGGVTWAADGATLTPLPNGGVQLTAPVVQRSTTIRLTATSAEEPSVSVTKSIAIVVPGGLVELVGDGPDPTPPELVAGDTLRLRVHITEGVVGLAGGAVHLSASMAGNSRLDLNLGPDAAQPPAPGPLLQGAQIRWSNDGVPDSGTIAIASPPPSGPIDGPGDILEFTVTVAAPDAVTQDQECTISVAADGLLDADGQSLGASGSGISVTVHPPGPVARVPDAHAMAGQDVQIPVLLAAWQQPVSNLTMALRVDRVAGGGAGSPSVTNMVLGDLFPTNAQVLPAGGQWVVVGSSRQGPGLLATFTVRLPADDPGGTRYLITPVVSGTLDPAHTNVPFRAVPGALTVWGQGKIDVSPAKPAVHAGQQITLTATLTGDGRDDKRIAWRVPSGIGAVAPTEGPSTVYTAPQQPQSQPVRVVATSIADPSLSGVAEVTVAPRVQLSVTPSSPVVPIGGRVTLTAQASGVLPGEEVEVEAGMRSDQPGKLVQTGPLTWDYYAPATMRTDWVRTANVLFYPQPLVGDPVAVPVQIASAAVSVTARPSTLRPGGQALLSAAVSGVTTGAVSWTPATVTPTGPSTAVFTAPAQVDAPTKVTITATSQEDMGVSGSTTVQILPQPSITATGPADPIPVGATAQLRAEVRYGDSPDVTWSMFAGPGVVDPKSGVYTAAAPISTPAVAVIQATSVAHPNLHADVTVRILPLAVALSADRAQIRAGQFAVLTATVANGSPAAIQWQVTGPPVGGILEPPPWGAKITYQAHDNVSGPAVVTVRVKSTQDPQQYAEVQLVVLPRPQLVVAPATANAFAGGQPVQFTATLSYISGPVAWSVPKGEAYGTITQDGLYTPPSVRPPGPDTPVAEVVAVCTDATDNTVQARGSATVRLFAVSVRILTPPQKVRAGQTVPLQAVAVGGLRNTVTWSVQSGPGEIVGPGAYKAPDVVGGPTSVTIRATSDDDPTKYAEVTMPVWPLIAVLVSPSLVTVPAGGTSQFTAKVLYADTQAVTWRVANGPGSIDPSQGIYTATIPVTTPAAATVQAVSAEDPNAVGSAQVAIPEVAVSTSPDKATVYVGSSVKLNATVQNAADPSVTWEVDGGPSNGTVSPDGIYTAPDTLTNANVTVRAKSRADPTKSGVVMLQTGDAPVVSVAPGEITMVVGQTIQFHASVSNTDDQQVVWSVEGPGTITQDGWFTAEAPPPGGREPIVRATSVRFPWVSGAASVHLAVVSVSVTPPTARVLGGQSVKLTAIVTGATDTSVTWSLEGVGTISADGTYQAPPNVAPGTQVRVIATSQADPSKWAAATITLGPVVVSVSPPQADVGLGEQVQFAATVTDANQAVRWSLDGPGAIDPQTGLYTAPATAPAQSTATVTATSVADPNASGTATVRLKAVSVTVGAASARVLVGDSLKLTATVDGALDQSVSWSTAGPGTVGADGTYRAPDTVASETQVVVTATSHADPSKSASAVITVVPVLVSISPAEASVGLGGQVTFAATVNGPADTSVTWDVAGPGSIKDGVYQAPDAGQTPATAVVSAISVAKPSARAAAKVTIPAVSVSIIGPGHDVQAGSRTQLFARVAGARNTAVTWSVASGRGQISPDGGVYSAPTDAAPGETATVRATSVADPTKHADLVIRVAQSSIAVVPSEATVPLGGSQQFVAMVAGVADSSVTWSLTGPGSLENGLYRAPASGATPAEATVTATSASVPGLSDTARVHIPAVSVAVQPPTAEVAAGGSPVRFTASVANAADTRVAWSLSGPGTLDGTGLYTPPEDVPQPATATVTAASLADPGKLATAIVTVSPAGLPEGAPWPMFRHDAQHTGLSGTIGPADPVAKWTVPLPTSLSSPAVGADGTLYIGTTDRSLVAVDARGELKWTLADTGGSQGWMRSSPAVAADGTIYAVDPDGALVAVSPDGAVRWRVPLTPPGQTAGYSSPAIGADGTVYVAGVRDLYALSRTGDERWHVTLGAVTTSSPAVARDGTIYIGCDDGALYAVSPDGNVRWRFHTSAPIRSAPAIAQDGTIYVGSWDMQAYAVTSGGTRKWAVSIGGDSIGSPAIGPDGTIYFPSGDGSLYAVSPGGIVKWRFQTGGSIIASPLVDAAGTIYVAGGDKTLYAVRPDGTQRWAYRAAGVLSGSPVMGGPGLIYLPSEEGLIHVLATAGDVDGDGRVTVADAVVALRLALGIIAPRKGQVAVADLAPPGDPRGDGKITTQDVTLILKRALGLDVVP